MYRKPTRGIQLNRSHPLSRGLVGCWLFNEGGGGVLNYANKELCPRTGTATWKDTQMGGGILFDYQNELVTSNQMPNITGKGLTLEVWLIPVSSVMNNNGLLQKGALSNNSGSYCLAVVDVVSFGLMFRLNNSITTGAGQVIGVVPHVAGELSHAVATYDGKYQRTYWNGKFIAQEAYSTAINSNTNPLYFGTYFSPTYPAISTITKASIWDRGLVAEEVKALYEQPFQMFESRTHAWMFYSPPVGGLSIPGFFGSTLSPVLPLIKGVNL